MLIPIPAQRVVALLAIKRRRLPRLNVAGTLWMDSTDDKALGSLRSSLWRLRGSEVVLSRGSTLEIDPAVMVDVFTAEEAARTILRGGLPLAGVLDQLLEWGELLPGWYDDWVVDERDRLLELRLQALEELALRLVGAGRLGEAVEAGLAIVAADPLRESGHAVLITAFVEQGNQALAFRHYEKVRSLLHRELGIEPSPRLRSALPRRRLVAIPEADASLTSR